MNVITYTNHDRKEFFFSRSHDDDWGSDWIVCTARLPMRIVPRKGIEDGFVRTLQQYVAVFHSTNNLVENPAWAINPKNQVPMETAEAKLLGAIFGENDERA